MGHTIVKAQNVWFRNECWFALDLIFYLSMRYVTPKEDMDKQAAMRKRKPEPEYSL